MQRLIKSVFAKQPPAYSVNELTKLTAHCTQKEQDAEKVERRLLKCAAAFVIRKDIGQTFKAMVTGASHKGTWIRVANPPIEGKLVKGFEGLDVGDHLTVKLIRVDISNGHIDFMKHSLI